MRPGPCFRRGPPRSGSRPDRSGSDHRGHHLPGEPMDAPRRRHNSGLCVFHRRVRRRLRLATGSENESTLEGLTISANTDTGRRRCGSNRTSRSSSEAPWRSRGTRVKFSSRSPHLRTPSSGASSAGSKFGSTKSPSASSNRPDVCVGWVSLASLPHDQSQDAVAHSGDLVGCRPHPMALCWAR